MTEAYFGFQHKGEVLNIFITLQTFSYFFYFSQRKYDEAYNQAEQ
ncbi:hypothetical protein QUB16_28250 [Microcoleus sp. D3_18a_C4]